MFVVRDGTYYAAPSHGRVHTWVKHVGSSAIPVKRSHVPPAVGPVARTLTPSLDGFPETAEEPASSGGACGRLRSFHGCSTEARPLELPGYGGAWHHLSRIGRSGSWAWELW